LRPPEKLLRALLLQVLYTVRSERMLMEQLDYNFLFRWFVGLSIDEVWDATVFSKNRDRLLGGEVANGFFTALLGQACGRGLPSDEPFTVDGTLIEAWAGQKSFKRNEPHDSDTPSDDDPGNPSVDFHGERRSNATHQSTTDPQALLARKGKGKDSKLRLRRTRVSPHFALTRHPGYATSQRQRKRVEEIFGWLKTVAGLRKTRHRGIARVGSMFTFALTAYNSLRLRNLLPAPA
jgi:Transposase domain (DUF772)/Transposase DDE domain